MATTYELRQKRNQYIALKNNLTYVKNELQNSMDDLHRASGSFQAGFSIDGSSADSNYIANHEANIQNFRKVILPDLENRIYNLNKEIQVAEAEEMLLSR